LRFSLFAILVAGFLFGLGYYPATSYDPSDGLTSLAYGFGLALFLMVPSYYLIRWALRRSKQIFMITFGVGFLARLVIFVAFFFVYSSLVKERDVVFALGFGICYLALSFLEVASFRSALVHKKDV